MGEVLVLKRNHSHLGCSQRGSGVILPLIIVCEVKPSNLSRDAHPRILKQALPLPTTGSNTEFDARRFSASSWRARMGRSSSDMFCRLLCNPRTCGPS